MLVRLAGGDDLRAGAQHEAVPGHRGTDAALGPRVHDAGIGIGFQRRRPQARAMKIVDQCEYGRGPARRFRRLRDDAALARQCETDHDQQDDESSNGNDEFLHGRIIPHAALLGHNAAMNATKNTRLPIGVFDSGVGGLTVLKAITQALPHEDLVYLGDTARLPYGTKSPTSIARYACQAAAVAAAT